MFALLLVAQLSASTPVDPFRFFAPSVTLTDEERGRLENGEPVTRILPGRGLEVAVFASVPVDVDGDRLVAWMRRIDALKKSSYVLAIGRFSNPPTLDDLAQLSLDDDELTDVRQCRPKHCALKLSAHEMSELRAAAAQAGGGWKSALQEAFRLAVLRRVQAYLAEGIVSPYDDHDPPVQPSARFRELLDRSAFLLEHAPAFVEHLRGYPQTAATGVESFLYWSKERLAGKPIISVTHVSIVRGCEDGLPDALVAGKEIFSTHYINASLSITAIVADSRGGPNYLVYVNRSEVDTLGGMFGGLVRMIMQRRLKAEAATVLAGLRRRLEQGGPPGS